MLLSFALILLSGLLVGKLLSLIRLPPLIGMIGVGILIGPFCLDLIDTSVLNISSQLRQIALVIILLRAGLNLKTDDLKKVGRPAILMCFVPASLEIIGMMLVAPLFFQLDTMDSLIMGTVIAAVSPAVIVPHMLKIMDKGFGVKKGVPQMILAGASADDVFVIVLFTSFTGMAITGSFEALNLLRIPTSILLGLIAGILIGLVLHKLFEKTNTEPTKIIIAFICISFVLVTIENAATGIIGFSGLIATMVLGITFANKSEKKAKKVSEGLSKIWTAAEIMLFVLVGATVDINYAFREGGKAILLIIIVLVFRMFGVLFCMIGTKMNKKERLFSMLAYTPKATVQAAIGAIPLSMGLKSGNTILTVAVVAILLTAPLGSFLIDLTYKKLLKQS